MSKFYSAIYFVASSTNLAVSSIGKPSISFASSSKTFEISLSDSIELIKRNSRRYAKRQYTFFNNQFDIKWFMVDFNGFNNTIDNICNYIENKNDSN